MCFSTAVCQSAAYPQEPNVISDQDHPENPNKKETKGPEDTEINQSKPWISLTCLYVTH